MSAWMKRTMSATTGGSESTMETKHEVSHKPERSAALPGILEDDENIDAAAKALEGQDLNFTEAEERKVLRKIDWRLMPLMAFVCGLQFVDKAAISNAATFGLRTDLNLQGSDYSWAVSIFYFGYLLGTYPSLYCMQRFHIGRFIGIMTLCWGATILAMIGVTSFGGLMAARFLLGLFEACLSPGFLAITTRWYKQKEQPFRFALWTLTNGLMPIPALVIYYGIGHSSGGALAPWRYIFVLLGSLTMVAGIICLFFLPNSPADVKWLSARERSIAVERVAESQTGISNTTWKWAQFKEAMTDGRAWLTVATLFLSQSGGAVTTNFIGIIINGFGYPQLKSLLLQTPAFAIQAAICLIVTSLVSFTSFFRRAKQPLLSVAACAVVCGTAVIYTHQPTAGNRNLLLGMMYMIALNNCSFTVIMSVIGTNFAGSTKKSTVSGMAFVAYCVSNIVVPQAFLGREAPTYHTGILTVMCFQIALVVCYWVNWTWMKAENRSRDRASKDQPSAKVEYSEDRIASGLKDMTDRENMNFRYAP